MKTIAIYIATSAPSDYYLEQTMMSAYTLRRHNPSIRTLLVTDEATGATLTGNRSRILEYVDEVRALPLPDGYNNMQKSRHLKTSLRFNVEGDYIFIDGDTAICAPLDELDSMEGDLCAVLDKHLNFRNHFNRDVIERSLREIGFELSRWDGRYFNSGVMRVADSEFARKFYEEWHRRWLESGRRGVYVDQPSMNAANLELGNSVREISGHWNCQVIDNGVKFLANSKIIHYFASTMHTDRKEEFPYLLKDASLYRDAREHGISGHLKELLDNPREAFAEKATIIGASTTEYLNSTSARAAMKVYRKFPIVEASLGKIFK